MYVVVVVGVIKIKTCSGHFFDAKTGNFFKVENLNRGDNKYSGEKPG